MLGSFITLIIMLFTCPAADQEVSPSALDLDGNTYIAAGHFDNDGNLVPGGGITAPLLLTIGHYPEKDAVYGSLVQLVFGSDAPSSPAAAGFGLEHLAVVNGKVKKDKKLKFDLRRGDTTVYKKVKVVIADEGNHLKAVLKNSKSQKVTLDFSLTDAAQGGLMLGNIGDAGAPGDDRVTFGNTLVGIIIPPGAAADPADDTVYGKMLFGHFMSVNDYFSYIENLYRDYSDSYYYSLTGSGSVEYWIYHNGWRKIVFFNDDPSFVYSGMLRPLGGTGNSPALINNFKVARLAPDVITVYFFDTKNIAPGFKVQVVPGGTGGDVQVIRTDYSPNAYGHHDGYAAVDIKVDPSFNAHLNVTVINQDGTKAMVTVPAVQYKGSGT